MPFFLDNTPGMMFKYCTDADVPAFVPPPVAAASSRPDDETIAYMTVMELASLIKNKVITSVELTQLFLDRLRKYDDVLQASSERGAARAFVRPPTCMPARGLSRVD